MSLPSNVKKNIKLWLKLYKDIVSNYECPAECNGVCCKKCDITLSEKEFKNIVRKRSDIKEILEQNVSISSKIIAGKELKQYEITIHPCPLLEDGRCSVHEINPIICKMYPFKSTKTTLPGRITIDPCPVGIQIALDFVIFDVVSQTGSFAILYYLSKEELISLKRMIEDSKHYEIDCKINVLQIPLECINPFAVYLKRSTKELLLSDRQILINKINSL